MFFLGAVTVFGGPLLERKHKWRFNVADDELAHEDFSCAGTIPALLSMIATQRKPFYSAPLLDQAVEGSAAPATATAVTKCFPYTACAR